MVLFSDDLPYKEMRDHEGFFRPEPGHHYPIEAQLNEALVFVEGKQSVCTRGEGGYIDSCTYSGWYTR